MRKRRGDIVFNKITLCFIALYIILTCKGCSNTDAPTNVVYTKMDIANHSNTNIEIRTDNAEGTIKDAFLAAYCSVNVYNHGAYTISDTDTVDLDNYWINIRKWSNLYTEGLDSLHVHLFYMRVVVNTPDDNKMGVAVPPYLSSPIAAGPMTHSFVFKNRVDSILKSLYLNSSGNLNTVYAWDALHEIGHQWANLSDENSDTLYDCAMHYMPYYRNSDFKWVLHDGDWKTKFCSSCATAISNQNLGW